MGWGHTKTSITEPKVEIVPLRGLSGEQEKLCKELRQETANCWNKLLDLFEQARSNGEWPDDNQLQKLVKGKYALEAQSVQALVTKFIGNVKTARANRQKEYAQLGYILTEYPYHKKEYSTTIWKRQAISLTKSGLRLGNGRGRDALLVKIPALYREANISRAELLYEAGEYSLALTIDTGVELPEPMEASQGIVCGGDLGEVHMVSLTTETGETLIISGRALRSFKQWRNKARARCAKALKRCQPESRRYQRLINKRNQISAKAKRQQRDYLHKAAKITVDFLVAQGVSVLYLGDVRNAADRVNLGKKTNQKISQWVHGEFRALVTEKARRVGIVVLLIDESYSTKTCCYCNHRRKSSGSAPWGTFGASIPLY
jgi:putative transposase